MNRLSVLCLSIAFILIAASTQAAENSVPASRIKVNPKSQPQLPQVSETPESTTAAPLTGVQWIKGSPVETFQSGHVYVVEFWATWCPPCRASIPHLTELQEKYQDKNLTIIGISNEDPDVAKPFVEKMGEKMDYVVASDPQRKVHENYMKAFGIGGIPHAFVIDQKGQIVWHGHPAQDMESVLELVMSDSYDPVAYQKKKDEEAAQKNQLMADFQDYLDKVQAGESFETTRPIFESLIEKTSSAEDINAMIFKLLTSVKEDKRDLDAALSASNKVIELTDGKDAAPFQLRGILFFQAKRFDEAVAAIQKAYDLLADRPDLQQYMQKTLETYKAAAEEQKNNPTSNTNETAPTR